MFNIQRSMFNYRGVKLNNKREAYLVKREAKKKKNRRDKNNSFLNAVRRTQYAVRK